MREHNQKHDFHQKMRNVYLVTKLDRPQLAHFIIVACDFVILDEALQNVFCDGCDLARIESLMVLGSHAVRVLPNVLLAWGSRFSHGC
jgi:hypothetical protein